MSYLNFNGKMVTAGGKIIVSSSPGESSIKLGYLYNWFITQQTDASALIPSNMVTAGWGVPSLSDSSALVSYIGGDPSAGGKLKEVGTTYWDPPNSGATNELNFNERGSGYRYYTGGFYSINQSGYWWTTTIYSVDLPWFFWIQYDKEYITNNHVHKNYGFPIRLFRPATTSEQSYPDGTSCGYYIGNDGKKYRTVKIGTQVWLGDNLAETKYRDGSTIPEVTDSSAWLKNLSLGPNGARCSYDNNPNNV